MISHRLKNVILRELDLDDFPMEDVTTANMVPGWDSLSHVQVVLAVEQEFKVHFKTIEIIKLTNLGDLQSLIDSKLIDKST